MLGEADTAWVSQALFEEERRRTIARVISVQSQDAVGKGENYGSDLKRIKVTLALHSGRLEEKALMFKGMPESPNRRIISKRFFTFFNEARMFSDVLPELEEILKEKEGDYELLWPKFYGYKRKFEGLLFEDLSVKGFKLANRLVGLDFSHCTLVLRSLGKFHALGAVLKENGDLPTKMYDKPVFGDNKEEMDYFNNIIFGQLADVLENKWKGEWVEYAEKVRKFPKTVSERLDETFKRDESKFCTLLHGDCWVNNMMFRYRQDGAVDAIRFIDFQGCYYHHPGFDVQYFLNTSPDLAARRRKPELLQVYYSSLEENLRKFEYPKEIPSFEDIQEIYQNAAYFGASVALGTAPLMMLPSDQAPDMEKFSEKFQNKEEFNIVSFDCEEENFVETLRCSLKEAAANNII